ncbi:MAG: DNA recombination protein RmuC [Candidatus Omnitrophota bacterium]
MNSLLLILLIILSFAGALWATILLIKLLKPPKPEISLPELMKVLADVGALKATLQTVEGGQRDLSLSIKETQRVTDSIKTDYDSRKRFFEELHSSIERMEQTISGTKRRGEAGENILQDILKSFPPQMIARGFRIGGKEVEFALVLSNEKVVPLDSKWAAQELLKQFAQESDPQQQLAIGIKIENEINKRVSEVAQYIDPARTVPWAVAAIPDAAFAVCRRAHLDAYRRGVIVIPYSLVVPYLLTLFNLHLQYAGTIDVENLQQYILNIKRQLEEMENILENSIVRAIKMISNAANEYRQALGSIRGNLLNLQPPKGNTDEKP